MGTVLIYGMSMGIKERFPWLEGQLCALDARKGIMKQVTLFLQTATVVLAVRTAHPPSFLEGGLFKNILMQGVRNHDL